MNAIVTLTRATISSDRKSLPSAQLVMKTLPTAAPTPVPTELRFVLWNHVLSAGDLFTALAVLVSGVALMVALATLILVIIQLRKMDKQTEVMEATKNLTEETKVLTEIMRGIADKELGIVETQTEILYNQHQAQLAREAKRAELVLFASKTDLQGWPNKVNAGWANFTLLVHNFGSRTCTEFRIIIGIPVAYGIASDAEKWTFLDDKKFKGMLTGYRFVQRNFEERVYPRESVQFYYMDLTARPDSLLPAPIPILWSIIHEDGMQPTREYTYFRMTRDAQKPENLVPMTEGESGSFPDEAR